MIHYHGLPITPETAAVRAISGGHAFISFSDRRQLGLAISCAQSFALDNGAFGAWRAGRPISDWTQFYEWVGDTQRAPSFDFAVIPDVIDGDESANDELIDAWPFDRHIGAPVWHLHESLARLERLSTAWPRVCLGSSGVFSQIGTPAWWTRMSEAMNAICDGNGLPACKLHGLRMLNPEVFQHFPFASADSTNIARNIGIDAAWRGPYTPPTKEARAAVMRERIESRQSAPSWTRRPIQQAMRFA